MIIILFICIFNLIFIGHTILNIYNSKINKLEKIKLNNSTDTFIDLALFNLITIIHEFLTLASYFIDNYIYIIALISSIGLFIMIYFILNKIYSKYKIYLYLHENETIRVNFRYNAIVLSRVTTLYIATICYTAISYIVLD